MITICEDPKIPRSIVSQRNVKDFNLILNWIIYLDSYTRFITNVSKKRLSHKLFANEFFWICVTKLLKQIALHQNKYVE